MAEIVANLITDKKEWENFLASHEEANFLQSWYFGEFHERLGKTINRTGFYSGKNLCGIMLSVEEKAKRAKYLTIPGGPIIDWKNKELVKKVFSEMKKIGKDSNCVFVRIRPQLIENEFSKQIFKENSCINSPMHLTADLTTQLDITKPDEELLSNMRKATRYEIRKAEKLGIKITSSKDEKDVKQFYNYQLQTAKRQKFVPFSYAFLDNQFDTFFKENKALLYTAKFEKKILAQAFVIFYGNEAVYHYGIGTEEGRKYPGAYLLQWEAIKEAKRRGLKKYNFWGVAPQENKNHRFSGVSLFKRGFGGEDVQYLHAQDLVINIPRYIVNFIIENIRKRARRV